ncbi:hypothetical protein FRB90_008253, partial [Tulasnella sp. 427]
MAANHLFNAQLHQHLNPIPIAPHPQQSQDPQMNQFGAQQQFNQPQLPQQTANMSRKRPKYSRSKMGCLSCRVRKVKCDENRPVCTRCAHGQRECTWPPDAPKSKKQQQQQEHDENPQSPSESAPGSRPSTASGLHPSSASDSDWLSDSGVGAIRNIPSVSAHSRQSSIGARRGRDLTMTSSASVSRNASANQSRDRSPNPFAFSIGQLGLGMQGAGLNGSAHQRSASTHSTTSNGSLPYPLISRVPPNISTMGVPGISSQLSSPSATAPFTQSPIVTWPSGSAEALYGSRPTSSSGLVAGMGNIDLNNLSNTATGLNGTQFSSDGDQFGFSFDGSNYANSQAFDQLSNNLSPNGFDSSNYDLNGTSNGTMDPFLNQLQNQQDLGTYTNEASSVASPNMDIEGLLASFDPRSMAGYDQYQQQQLPYGSMGQDQSQSASSMQDFLQAQTPMSATGFGLQPQSTPLRNPALETSPGQGMYGPRNSNPNSQEPTQMLNFGEISNPRFGESNLSDLQPRLLRQQPISYPTGEYGVTTSMFNPTSMKQEPIYSSEPLTMDSSTSEATTSPSYLNSFQMPATGISNAEFGSILGGIPPQLLPSVKSSSLETGPQMTEDQWQQLLYPTTAGGVGAEPFTDEARAGAQDTFWQPKTEEEETRMRIVNGMAQDLGLDQSQSANSQVGSLLEEVGRGPSRFEKQATPKPSFLQQRRPERQETLKPTKSNTPQQQQQGQLPTLFGSPSQKDQITFEPQEIPQSQPQQSQQYHPS